MVEKIFLSPLLRLLIFWIPALVPTPLHTLLFIVELVLLLGLPFHVDRGVVLIRSVVSYRHFFLKPRVKPGPEPVHFLSLISYINKAKSGEFHEL